MIEPTIKSYIDHRAANSPEKVFLISPEAGLELTYSKLKTDSEILGKQIAALGLSKGDKVSFLMTNGYQTAKIFLGVMYSGFVIAPLNLLAQPSQLDYVMDHSDTRLVFFTEDQRERVETAAAKIDREIILVPVDLDAEDVFSPDKDLSGISLPEVDKDDDALLLYTSGTTGVPKGAVLSHKNMVSGGLYTAMAHELTSEDRALCSLPLYHINGEVVTAVAPLVSGGSVVMPFKFSTSNFWEYISGYGCSWFSVVPTIIAYLVNSTEIEGMGYDLSGVRFGRSASSALPPSLHRAFEEKFGISIVETMGLTETAAPVFSNPMEPSKRKYGSPGKPVGNLAKIVDLEGREVPRRTEGEIMIKGDNVMKGYYKAPDKTAEAFTADGWLHTGDYGYMDEDDFVFVTGRIKELIIKGGENIAPREIDEVLYKHPCVLEAAAVGVPDELYGEEIMACIVLKDEASATDDEIMIYCQENLGKFKTPKIIKIVKELPKGPSGKIQRLKLVELFNEGKESNS
ncbi:MAG TPA: long-chain fatty acid--CoA ligase [Desulfobacteraceae bacterium]|nr:long-chain fatty acid--CoA ligase [Desulfobacteraceae bacterium]